MLCEFPAIDNFQVLCAGGILFLLALLVVARTQRRLDAKGPPQGALPPDGKDGRRGPGIDPAIRNDLSDILLRLEETSRRVNGQLETRFQTLNRLLADADARISELKALADRRLPPAPPGGLPADPQIAEICRHADAGMDPGEIARKTGRQRGEIDLILSLRKAAR